MTITLITLLKRRSGMSVEDFRAYYEASHRLIGEQVLSGLASRYERRFLTPTDGIDADCDFDVITEVDFPNAAARDEFYRVVSDPQTLAMIVEDEEKLFDRSRIRTFTMTSSVSDLPPAG